LDAGDIEAFAATDILAGEYIIGANHVTLGLGETGAIPFVCVAAELVLLTAHEPPDLILAWLTAVRTGQGVGSLLGAFVEKVAFFHYLVPPGIT
jgi:hypothetical protein